MGYYSPLSQAALDVLYYSALLFNTHNAHVGFFFKKVFIIEHQHKTSTGNNASRAYL